MTAFVNINKASAEYQAEIWTIYRPLKNCKRRWKYAVKFLWSYQFVWVLFPSCEGPNMRSYRGKLAVGQPALVIWFRFVFKFAKIWKNLAYRLGGPVQGCYTARPLVSRLKVAYIALLFTKKSAISVCCWRIFTFQSFGFVEGDEVRLL